MRQYIDLHCYTDDNHRRLLYTVRYGKTAVRNVLRSMRNYDSSINISLTMRLIEDEQTVSVGNYQFELATGLE